MFNPRGVEIPQKTTNLFDYSKNINDLQEVVEYLETEYPNNHFYFVGSSLGGALGVKYLANCNTKRRVKGMVSLANPFDVFGAATNANSFKNIIYGNFLTSRLVHKVEFNKDSIDQWQIKMNKKIDYQKVKNSITTFQFDKNFSFLIHHTFGDSKSYYHSLSCHLDISKVEEPVLFIQSKNDPISSLHN